MKNRREIIFIYDVRDSNPNGDPDDQNRPRMDENDYNVVTDLRLKRTIRDYWLTKETDGKRVLVRRKVNEEDGNVLSMKQLISKELNITEVKGDTRQMIRVELPAKFVDVRAFGVVGTVKDANVALTGPVQFAIGRSMNKPTIKSYSISSTIASEEGKGQGSLGEFHTVDYSLIKFHGIACEYNAKETNFTEEDLKYVYEGLWNGTKRLNTRSKTNHVPRLLVAVVSKESEFQIGDLDKGMKLEDENIKSPEEAVINISQFLERLDQFKDSIESIELKEDGILTFTDGETTSHKLEDFLSGYKVIHIQ